VRLGDLALPAAIVALAVGALPARAADDPFAWAPPHARAVVRGRLDGARFGLFGLRELEVEVDDVFDAANRQALALAEQHLRDLPGVRAVYGPSGLLDITVDGSGNPSARPVLARGESESEGEAARQRVVRRADALGWFLTENGRRARFYVDAPDWESTEPQLAGALGSSGLGLGPTAGATIESRPLWPDPRRHGARFLPLGFAAAWAFLVVLAASRARFPVGRRRAVRALAAAVGAAAPFVLVPVAGIRLAGLLAATGAGAIAFWALPRPDGTPSAQGRPRFLGPLLVVSAVLVAAGVGLTPRLRVGTRQWSGAPMFFVGVHADLDEPVVLREVRRLADYLRAQPGVANAWSVADLFLGVTFEGEETSGIPDDAAEVRRILVQARTDPAVQLELSPDHREALIGIRFVDDDPTIDRLAIVARAERYIERELRRSLVHLDFSGAGVSPVSRLVGQGLLAHDARERVFRICARSGRPLGQSEALSVERVARASALLPSADPARLEAEIADTVRAFAAHHPLPIPAQEVERLISAAISLNAGPLPDDMRGPVAVAYGSRLSEAASRSTAASLARRLAMVRRRHTERLDFREMLYGANLPTEGVLADEVRSATAEAMGPLVGLPVPPGTPGAFSLDAAAIGGAANDRALSEVWSRGLQAGLVAATGTIAILLVLVAGGIGILSLPLALAPLAVALAPSALLREAIGLPTLSFFCGALVGGIILALLVTPGPGQRGPR
jgi:hypothetical protein